MSDHIIIEINNQIQTIRFNRPDKKNALTDDMYGKAAKALERANEQSDIAVSIFLGCDGVFTAGNDVADFLSIAQGGTQGQGVIELLRNLASAKKPILAAVDGIAVGIGTTMLFHCDMVFASPEAKLKTPFVDLGLLPEAGTTLLGPLRMGYARAFELLCFCETFDAERAQAAGLINHIVPADKLEDAVFAAAQKIADKPQEALAVARALLRDNEEAVLARQEKEGTFFAERFSSPEALEAFTAFLEKRPPNFKKAH